MAGTLYLIPSTLGDSDINAVLPDNLRQVINCTDYYIVENVRTARRFLKKAGIKKSIDELTFFVLNKHTQETEISSFLNALNEGNNTGILSEAGCPAVADPGSIIVSIAHKKNFNIVPLVGPSSILLSLMASGFNGQNFAFNGYLPIDKKDKTQKIRFLEKLVIQNNQTQIFIETPYRNMQTLNDLLSALSPNTKLCIAVDLTLKTEYIKTLTAKQWKGKLPQIHKKTAIFLIGK